MSLTNWKLDLTIDLKAHGLAPKAEVDRLTRERDEARRTRTVEFDYRRQAEAERDAAREEAVKYRASAASPEVMRVLDALDKLKAAGLRDMKRRHWWVDPSHPLCNAEWNELVNAHSALSASRQPKAQEPLERWCVVDGDCHYTHDNEATARRHAKERGGLRVVHLREVRLRRRGRVVSAADAWGRE